MPSMRSIIPAVLALSGTALAVKPVEVRGSNFVTQSGERFMIVGVDYQPGGQGAYNPEKELDPLSDKDICLRDAALLQQLGVNTIRVYNVDPALNHDDCASIFNAVGIYMIIDVNAPFGGESLDRSDPKSSYHVGYMTRVFGVVENFKNYPNTLGFFAANEVMNDLPTAEENPPYIRAVQRDLKNYIANHCDRTIPVGYSAADVRPILEDTWAYFQCAIDGDENDMSRSDFFGLNSYSWCGGDATFDTSGYDDLVSMFGESTVPVFFSEYGCNDVMPRVFDEVQSLYGEDMTSLSGGLVYEYSQEPSNYGLVTIEKDDSVNLLSDYDSLQEQYGKLDVKLLQSANPDATAKKPPRCSDDIISEDAFSKTFDIPEVPRGVQDLIDNGIDNPKQGQIKRVTDTASPFKAFGVDGEEIKDLAIVPLPDDQTNWPGTVTSENGPKPSKKNDADTLRGTGVALLATCLAAFLMF